MDDYIRRNEAIDVLATMQGSCTSKDALVQNSKIWKQIKNLPSADVPHWIPCSEKLPDEDYWTGANFQYSADVLMTVYNAEDEETIIDYGHTVDGSWYSETTDCLVPSWWEVLAWMPLPEPYEEGEQNETDRCRCND